MTRTNGRARSELQRFLLGISFVSLGVTTLAAGVGRGGGAPGQSRPRSGALLEPVLPELPVRAASGGEVWLDVEVAPDGQVTDVDILRTTPPFTEPVLTAVRAWRFEPLPETEEPRPERVLIAALFRAPSFYSATTAGTPPVDTGSSAAVPLPTRMVAPPYPPNAKGDGVVVVEARIGSRGEVLDAAVRGGGPPFDAAALEGLRGWRFRPAQASGGKRSRPSAVVIFGFREPVVAR